MVGNRALGQLAEAFTAEDAKSAEWTEQTTAYTLTGDVREGGHTFAWLPLRLVHRRGSCVFPAGRDFGCRLGRRQNASIFSCQRTHPFPGPPRRHFKPNYKPLPNSPATAGSRLLKSPRLASESLDADTSGLGWSRRGPDKVSGRIVSNFRIASGRVGVNRVLSLCCHFDVCLLSL